MTIITLWLPPESVLGPFTHLSIILILKKKIESERLFFLCWWCSAIYLHLHPTSCKLLLILLKFICIQDKTYDVICWIMLLFFKLLLWWCHLLVASMHRMWFIVELWGLSLTLNLILVTGCPPAGRSDLSDHRLVLSYWYNSYSSYTCRICVISLPKIALFWRCVPGFVQSRHQKVEMFRLNK